MKLRLWAIGCHLPYVITQCYLPPDISEHSLLQPVLTPARGRYLIYLPQRDERLSWPRWLVKYWDGLPAHRQSPIYPSKY